MNTLDTIVKSVLLRKRVSMHYYLDALLAARDCLRDLTLHHLQIVNTRRFSVDENGISDFGGNIADIVGVFSENGVELRYEPSTNGSDALDTSSLNNGLSVSSAIVSRGTYKSLSGRNKLSITGASGGSIIISYIGDGRDADSASHVDVYAEAVIEAYILWQFTQMSRAYSLGEKEVLKNEYKNQVSILRSVKANWNIPQLRKIVQRTYNRRSGIEINSIA